MSDPQAARDNLVMALDDAADLLQEHGQESWAAFLRQVVDQPEDEGTLDRLRDAYGELADVVLDPGDADADALFQQRLGHAWVALERLSTRE